MSETNLDPTGKTEILKKMHLLTKATGYIKKTGRNRDQGYSYLTDEDLSEVVRKAAVEVGVVITYSFTNSRLVQLPPTKNNPGVPTFKTEVDVEVTFWDPETGQSLTMSCIGTGNGRDDKGTNGALTCGKKYALITNLLIPSGDDPEDPRNEEKPVKPRQQPARPAGTTANAGEAKPQTPASGNQDFFEELKWLQTYEDMLIKCGMTHEKVATICKAATGKSVDQMEKATPIQRRNYKEALLKALEANGVTVEAANG